GGPFTVSLASGLNPALLTLASGPAILAVQPSNQLNLPIQPANAYPTSSDVITFSAFGAVSLAFNGAQAPNPLNDTAATTTIDLQTYLATIPGLTGPGSIASVTNPSAGTFVVNLGPGLSSSALSVASGPAQINLPGSSLITVTAASATL